MEYSTFISLVAASAENDALIRVTDYSVKERFQIMKESIQTMEESLQRLEKIFLYPIGEPGCCGYKAA